MKNTETKVNQVWNIPERPIIRRCAYCRCIMGEALKRKTYCSDWCKEMGMMILVKKHYCPHCNKELLPYPKRKNSEEVSTTYPDKCRECYLKIKEEKKLQTKLKKIKIKKERSHKYNIDRVGHICYKCKEYKLLSEFTKNKNAPLGIVYRCKKCSSLDHKEYYKKNKEKCDAIHREYLLNRKKALINKDKIELEEMK